MIKKKGYIIVVFLFISFLSYGKSKDTTHCDTIVVLFRKYSDFKKNFFSKLSKAYYNNDDTLFFYIKHGMVRKKDNRTGLYYDFAWIDACYHIYKFISMNKKIIAIGSLGAESFSGQYKEYYESGILMKTGTYDCCGHKDKTWRFFDVDGKLIKEEEYDKDSLLRR